jgi:type IV pilus assembly protein PilY1
MGDPITVDVNLSDKVVDAIYIGNTYCPTGPECSSSNWQGKIFRITTNKGNADTSGWALATLFDPAQPVTAAPSITLDNRANLWVYLGTGRYYSIDDSILDGTESWGFYGLKERCLSWLDPGSASCSTPVLKANLLDATDIIVKTDESVENAPASADVDGDGVEFSELEGVIDNDAYDGWFIDFPNAGERSLFKPGLLGGIVSWTTFSPQTGDICSLSGNSRLYASFYKTGTAFKQPVIGVGDEPGDVKTIKRELVLGRGVPSSVGFAVTGENTTKGFVQQSTGAIIQLEEITPFGLKSGFTGLRTKSEQPE